MSKKHFERIAYVISLRYNSNPYTEVAEAEQQIVRDIAEDLCTVFEEQNPNFRRNTFLEACGIIRR